MSRGGNAALILDLLINDKTVAGLERWRRVLDAIAEEEDRAQGVVNRVREVNARNMDRDARREAREVARKEAEARRNEARLNREATAKQRALEREVRQEILAGNRISSHRDTLARRAEQREKLRQRQFGTRALGASSLLFGFGQAAGFAGLNIGFAAMAGPQFALAAAVTTTIGLLGRRLNQLADDSLKAAESLKVLHPLYTAVNRSREKELALIGNLISRDDAIAEMRRGGLRTPEEASGVLGFNRLKNIGRDFLALPEGLATLRAVLRTIAESAEHLGMSAEEISRRDAARAGRGLPDFRMAELEAARNAFRASALDEQHALGVTKEALEAIAKTGVGISKTRAEFALKKVNEELREFERPGITKLLDELKLAEDVFKERLNGLLEVLDPKDKKQVEGFRRLLIEEANALRKEEPDFRPQTFGLQDQFMRSVDAALSRRSTTVNDKLEKEIRDFKEKELAAAAEAFKTLTDIEVNTRNLGGPGTFGP